MTADDGTRAKGAELLRLHQDEKLLTLVNVWDVISARTVAAVEGTTALATASHSIAASFGYEDGENIPLDLHLEQIKRIVDSTDLPVTADLEGGYGDAADKLAMAVERGKAFLDAGAPVVFVPAILDEEAILTLVDAFGPQRLTTIGIPGLPPRDWQEAHGVARTSYGPLSQNVALTALQELVEEVHRGGGVPSNLRILN